MPYHKPCLHLRILLEYPDDQAVRQHLYRGLIWILWYRWQAAAATLINSASMVKDINTVSDRLSRPADR